MMTGMTVVMVMMVMSSGSRFLRGPLRRERRSPLRFVAVENRWGGIIIIIIIISIIIIT